MIKRSSRIVAAFLVLITVVAGVTFLVQNPDLEVTSKVDIPVLDDSGATAESLKATVDASNAFALDLYGRYSAADDNLFYSPYSISTALSMTYEGARGTTAEEMRSVFHLSEDDDVRRPGAARTFNILNGKDRPYTLVTANALWMREGYPFKEDYVQAIQDYYGGEANPLDFGDTVEAAGTINGWVEERTYEKIKDLFSPSDLEGALLVLTNAIYFKGDWAGQFDEADTTATDFHVTPTETVEVDMMSLEGSFNYANTSEAQVLELPYKGGDLSMIVILPEENDIHGFEAGLTLETYGEWVSQLESTKLNVFLPKFKLETKYDMGRDLAEMGMPTAFSGEADFSGISDGGMFISKVIHQAYVDVNEEGTEAAAATGVVTLSSAPMLEEFRADHPFIFVIRDRDTGLILFMGRVIDPS
ncbi:MAG TPA: serpin family protein [Candidatus Bathyarchaeia archaeon]